VYLSDTAGQLRFNRVAVETLGTRLEAASREVLERALRGEASIQEVSREDVRTGESRVVRQATAPVRLRERIVGAVSIHTDITQLTRAQQEREGLLASEQAARTEAERANRRKDEFLARVSHELATPLLSMRLWLDMLQLDPGRTPEALAALRQSTQAQSKLVHDLLDTARALNGKLSVSLEACEPAEPLRAAVSDLLPLARQRGVTLEVALEPTSLVLGDAERLRQVVSNLVSNAVKYTPSGGRVDVSLRSDEAGVRLTVRDTGRGFPSEFVPLLFVPFRQEEEGTTRTHGGLGLGLSITRQLVELHGGRVGADSPGRGQGATFTVWLPALPESLEVPGADVSEPLERPLADVHLLLVEDDALTRTVVASVLEQHGARVFAVDGAERALEVLRALPVDALLCDIAMPGEDGYGLIRKVRSLEGPVRQIPAAAFTAHMREEDRLRALDAGFQMHISKVVDAAQLLLQVRALLDHAASGRA